MPQVTLCVKFSTHDIPGLPESPSQSTPHLRNLPYRRILCALSIPGSRLGHLNTFVFNDLPKAIHLRLGIGELALTIVEGKAW